MLLLKVFTLDPQYIDFGTLFQDWSTDATLVLRNRSERTANLAVAVIGPDKESFTVSLEGHHGLSVFEVASNASARLKVINNITK